MRGFVVRVPSAARWAVGWGILAGLVDWLCAVRYGTSASSDVTYFDVLARSFLDGHLSLPTPASKLDLTVRRGQYFVPFPPLPALLMLPFVAVLGVDGFNSVVFACVVGGLTTASVHLLLRAVRARGLAHVTDATIHWLTGAWAFGSVAWYMSMQGSVWFLGQTTAALFASLALLAAVRRRPWWSAALLGIAMIGRPTLVLMLPALVLLVADSRTRSEWVRPLWRMLVPVLVVMIGFAGYNQARFGSVTEFGYARQRVAQQVSMRLKQQGQFDLSFVPENTWAALVAGPHWNSETDSFEPDPWGMSILITTPAVLLALRARRRLATVALWSGIGLVAVPLLTYYNTGWWQFGYRFALDLMPMLWVVMLIGAADSGRSRSAIGSDPFAGDGANPVGALPSVGLGRVWQVLIVIGVFVNYWGMTWFG